jgi:hypothetical protein
MQLRRNKQTQQKNAAGDTADFCGSPTKDNERKINEGIYRRLMQSVEKILKKLAIYPHQEGVGNPYAEQYALDNLRHYFDSPTFVIDQIVENRNLLGV